MKTLTLLLSLAFALGAGAAMQKDDVYRAGQRDIDAGRWTQAIEKFGQVARKGGSETDAALYWKAYAENKAGRSQNALATLRRLSANHRGSEWQDDAKALEVEIRGGSAEPNEDEELKLYALNGLMGSDPERAVPMLQKFLRGNHSPRLKAQALFVLSQSDSPEGHKTLVEVARGSAHPELQLQGIEYLGTAGGDEAMRALDDIYRSSARPEIKQAVLQAYHVDDRTGRILAIARDGKDPLQGEAIQILGAMEARQELRQLYQSEPESRMKIVEALGIADDVETLAGIARQEQNPALQRQAIQGLGVSDTPEAAKALRSLYGASTDLSTRKAILEAFMIQDNARALIEIFNAEKDREIRKEIVQHLASMDSDEAEKFLERIYEN
ncbi:MAG TPA: HEAT repeat domain-containing protein [Thermoanaerobaculia bacterium]|nr:HEAT repeat domain-containing protein [Thermoanaerobaculia bacterium]